MKIKQRIRSFSLKLLGVFIPDIHLLEKFKELTRGTKSDSELHETVKMTPPFILQNAQVGRYTYIAQNSIISHTTIGQFCSIGPNFLCGWGIHPLDGISTSPMFYSTLKQNGSSLTEKTKIEERKPISIGNDVFIGMNVTILDGITIGDGAVVGAGCIVSKDVPPYAIVAGNPMQLKRYRFQPNVISELLSIQWWNYEYEELKEIERNQFDVEGFIKAKIKK